MPGRSSVCCSREIPARERSLFAGQARSRRSIAVPNGLLRCAAGFPLRLGSPVSLAAIASSFLPAREVLPPIFRGIFYPVRSRTRKENFVPYACLFCGGFGVNSQRIVGGGVREFSWDFLFFTVLSDTIMSVQIIKARADFLIRQRASKVENSSFALLSERSEQRLPLYRRVKRFATKRSP